MNQTLACVGVTKKKTNQKSKKNKFFAEGLTIALGKEFRNLKFKLFAEGYS